MLDIKNKTFLITGGTGSFGKAVITKLLSIEAEEIRVFSRDEKKQDDLRNKYSSDRLKFYIGDVRDFSSISDCTKGVDFIFHAAALKQVPSCEHFPMEAIKTNALGTENVLTAAIENSVSKVVCLSTDKAVYPINAMGLSKAIMEKLMIAKARNAQSNNTIICGTRYGNVMASRGSVIPLFFEQTQNGIPITITDPNMTRFMMSLDEAVNLVLFAFENGRNGDIFVQKSPAATISTLAEAILQIFNKKNDNIEYIGTRLGEKLFEVLLSREEMVFAKDLGEYFCIPANNKDLKYDEYEKVGQKDIASSRDYNSHNTTRLNTEQMKQLLFTLPMFKNYKK